MEEEEIATFMRATEQFKRHLTATQAEIDRTRLELSVAQAVLDAAGGGGEQSAALLKRLEARESELDQKESYVLNDRVIDAEAFDRLRTLDAQRTAEAEADRDSA